METFLTWWRPRGAWGNCTQLQCTDQGTRQDTVLKDLTQMGISENVTFNTMSLEVSPGDEYICESEEFPGPGKS